VSPKASAVAWNTANDAVLAEGKRVLIDDPGRFEAVTVIGVDEHVWRHTRRGDKYVTVIIDLTPIRAGSGPARLLDMLEGRSKQAFKQWLAARPQAWRDRVEVVAMDGFTGFKTATSEELPDAVAVMDPFHAVRLAGDALDQCRRRLIDYVCACRLVLNVVPASCSANTCGMYWTRFIARSSVNTNTTFGWDTGPAGSDATGDPPPDCPDAEGDAAAGWPSPPVQALTATARTTPTTLTSKAARIRG